MVAGHLREQNGYYQMILSWKGKDEKRKGKSISTGLPVKGNKKRAEAMLLKTRKEFNPDNLMENADMLFTDFLSKWLKDKAVTLGTSTYAEYAYDVKNYIVPYFQEHPIALLKMTARDLENFYRHERQQNEATANELLLYHEVIVTAFQYAVDLEWIRENIMAQVNPCADEAPILFTGGVSHCQTFARMLESHLGMPVNTHPDAQFAGAIGAAVIGQRVRTRR